MKKIIISVISVLLVFVMSPAAQAYTSRVIGSNYFVSLGMNDLPHDTSLQNAERKLDDKTKEEILDKLMSERYQNSNRDDIVIKYYGKLSGGEMLIYHYDKAAEKQEEKHVSDKIYNTNVSLWYNTGNKIKELYIDGNIYTVKEAADCGLIGLDTVFEYVVKAGNSALYIADPLYDPEFTSSSITYDNGRAIYRFDEPLKVGNKTIENPEFMYLCEEWSVTGGLKIDFTLFENIKKYGYSGDAAQYSYLGDYVLFEPLALEPEAYVVSIDKKMYGVQEACKKGLIDPDVLYKAMNSMGKIKDSKFRPSHLKLLGDVNNDGVVNIDDSTAIQKHISQLEKLSDKIIADANGDGRITIDDASRIQKKECELIDTFGVFKKV